MCVDITAGFNLKKLKLSGDGSRKKLQKLAIYTVPDLSRSKKHAS
jgi:hypothetical protein